MLRPELKQIQVPYSDKMFLFKTVLFEKYVGDRKGLFLCCYINDVPIYRNNQPNLDYDFMVGHKQGGVGIFVVVGCDSEHLKTDSFIIWHIVKAIKKKQENVKL